MLAVVAGRMVAAVTFPGIVVGRAGGYIDLMHFNGFIYFASFVREHVSICFSRVAHVDCTLDIRPIRCAAIRLPSFGKLTGRPRLRVSLVWCLRNPNISMVEAAIMARLHSTS